MEKWFQTCLLLCLFGFLKEMRPSEPFLTEYLTGPWQNLTNDQAYQQVYPVWTYSYLALLIVVFIVTDYLLYKPVVVFEGISFVSAWCLLLWGHGVTAMQGVEFLYASATATQVAYSTYIYVQVPFVHFQIVTAYTQAALLTGRCLAGVLGQTLTTSNLLDYYSLNFISLGSVILATIVACILPSASKSIYFHRGKPQKESTEKTEESPNQQEVADFVPDVEASLKTESIPVYRLLWLDFISAFSNPYLLKWSLWWAFAMCGNFQVLNYIQSLWKAIASESESSTVYNGAVEALHTLLSAIATIAIGYTRVDWSTYGEPVIAAISIFEGIMLFTAGNTSQLWVSYLTYMLFCISYCALITIASSEVAKGLKRESYGLVFGINTFLALLFQTILTLVVTDEVGFALEPKDQFKVYGGYYVVLGSVFLSMAAFNAGRRWV